MKRMYRLILLSFLVTFPLVAQQAEKLLISGCGWNKVAMIDKETEAIEWIHTLAAGEDCNDVELTKEGAVLYAYTKGARLVSFTQQVLWDYKAAAGEELFTATQLPSGNYMLGICGIPSRIVELDKNGVLIDEFILQTSIMKVHDQFRQLILTDRNTYLIPLMGEGRLVEIDRTGKLIRSVEVGGNPFSVRYINSDKLLVSCGDAHKFVEVDLAQGKVTKEVHTDLLDRFSLLFVAELIRYPNGNTLIANWNGHSEDKTQPKLLEVDQNNRVVWFLKPSPEIGNISAVWSFK